MTIEAPAKINLFLEVLGKRADGYHALRSLIVPVTLSDTLEIEPAEGISSDTGYPDDLCVRAAAALKSAMGPRGAGLGARIRVVKRIPAGGGLGGGSADAAATLSALDSMWGAGFGERRLAEIGASVGSDVPALVLARRGVPVVMEGRGETVSVPEGRFPPLHVVLANPGVHSSTAEVFARTRFRVTDEADMLYNMVEALGSGDADAVARRTWNGLEEAAVGLHPEIADAKAALVRAGAKGVAMTGSGSTVFGLAPSRGRAEEIAASARSAGLSAWSAETCCPVV